MSVKIKAFHAKPKENDLYIQFQRPLAVYRRRVRRLVLKGFTEFELHAMGASIRKAFQLLQLCRDEYPLLTFVVETATVTCFAGEEQGLESKKVSCVHIKISRL